MAGHFSLWRPFAMADLRYGGPLPFRSLFARSDSTVISSEKSSININRKSMHYALSNEPKMNILRCP